MDDKKILVAERMVVLQAFAEYYLRLGTTKSFEENFPEIKDEYGKLNPQQEKILHSFLAMVYNDYGLDLEKILKEKGETPKPGEYLTEYERKELCRLADLETQLLGAFIKRKDIK